MKLTDKHGRTWEVHNGNYILIKDEESTSSIDGVIDALLF